MAKPPRAVGPLLCHPITFTPPAVMSLVGLFNARTCPGWPAPPDPFYFYALLLGGEGDGLMELVVLHAATEQIVSRYRHWYTVPRPGRYLVSLRFDGEIVTQRPLDVRQPTGQ